MEAFFESNPWLLIPIIILTVEGWTAFKRAVVAWRDKERLRSKASLTTPIPLPGTPIPALAGVNQLMPAVQNE